MREIRAIDLFCGAGGSSWGAKEAGAKIVAGFDMWSISKDVYCDNFNDSKFYLGMLEELDPTIISGEVGKIDLILASPECTNHSPAKGNKPRCEVSKNTAFQVVRYAEILKSRWIVVENVISMRKWNRYREFIGRLHELGYNTHEQVLNSADFGVPQARKRLFILCDKLKQPKKIGRINTGEKTARTIIEGNGKYRFSPLRTERRAAATIERADRAIAALGYKEPFLLVYYGSDQAGGWQTLNRPLRTITTLDRFALVRPNGKGHEMRMLQPEELKAAMSMPKSFKIEHGTRRNKIKLIGNAVCPKVMEKVVQTLNSGQ